MFQLKISAAIFVVVLALMGFAYFTLTNSVTESILRGEAEELSLASKAVEESSFSAKQSLVARAQPLAKEQRVIELINRARNLANEAGGIEPLRRQANRVEIFDYLMDWRKGIARGINESKSEGEPRLENWWGAKPDLVLAFVTVPLKRNRSGQVLLAYAEKGQELQGGLNYSESLPVLARTEEAQEPQIDVISWASFEYFVVSTPVFNNEDLLIGTVVIGYQLGSDLVDRLADVAIESQQAIVFSGDRLYSASNSADVREKLYDAEFHPVELKDNQASIDFGTSVQHEDLESDAQYYFEVDGMRFLLQRNDWNFDPTGASEVGIFMLTDFKEAVKPVDSLKYQIPLVGVVILLVALVITLIIIRSFLRPIEAIDVGIQEILAGNKDYVFRASSGNPLHGELVNSLNQLSAFLQGRDIAGEGNANWDELMVDLEPERPSIYGMQAVQVVQSDKEKEALRALYDEYMAKRKELDQWVDMDFDRFCRRIKRNETSLKEKHNCKAVEFSVAVADGKVVLKPTPIK